MPKVNYTQKAFSAGELSPKLLSRDDFDKYKSGCQVLENFIPTIQGSLQKRTGTKFVAEVKTSNLTTVLYPFRDTNGTAYMLEFGHQYIRFFKEDGEVVGGPYELAAPFIDNSLHTLSFAQSGDVLYIASSFYAPRKLTKNSSSDTDWSIDKMVFDYPPLGETNTDSAKKFYVSANTGSITVTAVGHSPFTAAMAQGDYYLAFPRYRKWLPKDTYGAGETITQNSNSDVYEIQASGVTGDYEPTHKLGIQRDGVGASASDWEYLHTGPGLVKITAYNSSTSVDGEVVKTLNHEIVGSGNETEHWAFSTWSEFVTGGTIPQTVALYEDRLLFGGSTVNPQTIWGSATGDYENFLLGTNDDDSFEYTIGSDQINQIRWMSPGRTLLVGTDAGEFSVSGTRIYEGITPTNVRIGPQTSYGSAEHRAVRFGEDVFFTEVTNVKLRKMTYNYEIDGYQATDVSVLSEHLPYPSIGQGAKQETPTPIMWYPRYYWPTDLGDGCLLGFSYNPAQQITAWHKHTFNNAFIESAAVLNKANTQQLWMIVKRTINGATKRYVEYMDAPSDIGLEDSHYLDCGTFYDGAATSNITGLSHLEGETVQVIGDGAVQTDKVVSSGQITLDTAASKVHVGYGYTANMQSMPIVPDGQATGLNSRITTATVRLLNTGEGIAIGPDANNLIELDMRSPGDLMDAPVPLFSGLIGPTDWHDGFSRDNTVYIRHDKPVPCELCSFTVDIMVYDE